MVFSVVKDPHPKSVTVGATYETIDLRGIARRDDMSHEGRQPKPGATTLASQPSTMSSAVTGKRSLTEALSPQIAETTNVPPVQKQTGDGVRDEEAVHTTAARSVAPPAVPRPTLQELFRNRHTLGSAAHVAPHAIAPASATGTKAYATSKQVGPDRSADLPDQVPAGGRRDAVQRTSLQTRGTLSKPSQNPVYGLLISLWMEYELS